MKKQGKVYLVGAGPGDPGLITCKGRDLIARADVICHDYLANPLLLRHARADAELIYTGKQCGRHSLSQDEINELLVAKAQAGHAVVRLKGGDPFIFGRGAEEAEELLRAGVAFEVVPGVTSAVAAPAYAGIPLTHRRHNTLVTFATGHEDPDKPESTIDWRALAARSGTLVVLMGVKNLASNCRRLVEAGRPADTPAALVRWGTYPRQATLVGTLSDIAAKADEAGFEAPAVMVVGGVVGLREDLNWFEGLPLFGKRILVTRARHQASEFSARLAELGADVREYPTIEITDPESWGPLDKAIFRLDEYDWLVFTSANGVEAFFRRLGVNERDVRDLHGLKLAAIGPATAESLEAMGLRVDAVPREYRAEALVELLREEGMAGRRFLIPRALVAREVLPEELRAQGAKVDVVPAYRTLVPREGREELAAGLRDGEFDMVTFASSSTVENFAALLQPQHAADLLADTHVAAIGPITARTAQGLGIRVDVEPEDYTIAALTEAIAAFFAREDTPSQPGLPFNEG